MPARLRSSRGVRPVRFAPGLGGKVTSLRLGAGGREWLARPVHTFRAPAPGRLLSAAAG